jgi:hypothetical protein
MPPSSACMYTNVIREAALDAIHTGLSIFKLDSIFAYPSHLPFFSFKLLTLTCMKATTGTAVFFTCTPRSPSCHREDEHSICLLFRKRTGGRLPLREAIHAAILGKAPLPCPFPRLLARPCKFLHLSAVPVIGFSTN